MGFYLPSQLVQDARRHGVEVRPVDVMHSDVDCTLEDVQHQPAVRLGLRMVAGLKAASAARIVQAREDQVFDSAEDLARRVGLELHEMKLLAAADALMSLAGHQRQQVWEAAAVQAVPEMLREAPVDEEILELPPAHEGEEIVFDGASTGLTLRRHPLSLLRNRLQARGFRTSEELDQVANGMAVSACGIVTLRQQPDTANATIFVSLEDEPGAVQVIVWKSLREVQRQELLRARLMGVHGTWQREGEVKSLIAGRIEDLTPLLGRLGAQRVAGTSDRPSKIYPLRWTVGRIIANPNLDLAPASSTGSFRRSPSEQAGPGRLRIHLHTEQSVNSSKTWWGYRAVTSSRCAPL